MRQSSIAAAFEGNEKDIVSLCRSFFLRYKSLRRFGITADDVLSSGLEIFVRIFPEYDRDKQPSLTAYLTSKMWLKLCDAYRSYFDPRYLRARSQCSSEGLDAIVDYRTDRHFELSTFLDGVNPDKREDVRATVSALFDKFLRQPSPTKARSALKRHLLEKMKWTHRRVSASFDQIRQALSHG